MGSRGYTNQYLVSDVIGKHDGVPPVAMLDVLIEAAENWVDGYTKLTWLISSVTGEQHTLTTWPPTNYPHYRTWGGSDWWEWSSSNRRDAVITLSIRPVTAVTAVRTRSMYVGAPITTLVSGTDYELADPALGQLLVIASWFGTHLAVDYTVNVPVPADIKYATSLLVASWLQPMLNSGMSVNSGIKAYSIGPDLSVTFQDRATNLKLAAPPEVINILDDYANVLIGF